MNSSKVFVGISPKTPKSMARHLAYLHTIPTRLLQIERSAGLYIFFNYLPNRRMGIN